MGIAAVLLALGLQPLRQPEPPSVWRVDQMPAEHHPCLLFATDQLPAIRERLQRPPYAGWWSGVQGSDDMVSQAFTWRMTGDEEKAQAVRERLLRCNPTGYHCCCGVADALQGVAEAYDLLHDYPGLSETDHRVIRAKIANACERLYLSALETGNGQHPGNQRTRGICALGTAAMVLADYEDAAHTPQEWLQRALDGIHEGRNLQFWRDDGMFIEGPTYSAFTLSVMLPFARYYDNFAGKWLFDDPRLRNALQYLVYVTQPDGDCNAMGTTNMQSVVNSLKLCVGAGDPRDQAAFRWALDEWGSLSGGVRELCLFDDTVKPSISGLPTARFFPVSQEAALRNEWSRNALALWFKGKDPWIAGNYPVYSHGDAGNFVLHAYGELLAVDAGYDHWVSYNLYPANLHNTLLVDGEGPTSETAGVVTNMIDAPYLQGGTIEANYAGITLRRTFLLVEGEYAVVFDEVQAEDEHEYEWLVHTPVSRKTGTVEIAGNRAFWTGFDPRTDNPGHVEMEAYWAGPVSLEATERSRWQPYSADPKTGSYDNWAIAARQRGTNVRYLAIFYPVPTGAAGPNIEEKGDLEVSTVLLERGRGARDRMSYRNSTEEAGTDQPRLAVRHWTAGSVGWDYALGPGVVRDGNGACMALDREGAATWVTGEPIQPWRVHVAGPTGMRVGTPGYFGRPFVLLRADGRHFADAAPGDRDLYWFTLPEDVPGPVSLVPSLPDKPFEPDTTAPELTEVQIDERPAALSEVMDLGRVARPPWNLALGWEDSGLGVSWYGVRCTLDGRRCYPKLQSAPGPNGRFSGLDFPVPPVTEPTDHELVVRIPDRAAPPNAMQFNLRFSLAPLLANGGFEETGGWSFGDWSRDAQTDYEIRAVADNPHSGKRCLLMRGIAGGLNMIASQTVPLKLGETYVLRGYYRGDAPASASLCNQAGTGQYIWSPPIEPSADWKPFEWEFTAENPGAPLIIALRLGQVGAAYFDDLELVEKAEDG